MGKKEERIQRKQWNQAAWDMLYLVQCGINSAVPDLKRVAKMDLEKVYARSKSQSLEALAYMALESLMKSDPQVAIPDETQVLPSWRAAKNKAVAKNLKMDAEREQLFAFLEEQGIWYVALKGIVLCHLYPKYGMRQMADNDILFDASFRQEVHDWFVEQGYEVVHLNLGSALSSAHQNCMLAARELKGVYPVDSGNLSTGIGHLVLDAGEMIRNGMGAEEIAERLKERKSRVHSSFVLDTLKFMSAGGRCSSITALGANLLNIKPCIQVDNTSGAMAVGKKYRGTLDKVLPRYVKDTLQSYEKLNTRRLFITHSGIEESYIQLVKEAVEKELSRLSRMTHPTRLVRFIAMARALTLGW